MQIEKESPKGLGLQPVYLREIVYQGVQERQQHPIDRIANIQIVVGLDHLSYEEENEKKNDGRTE